MLSQPYFYKDETGQRPEIRNKHTDMRLEVYNLEDEQFSAPDDKLVFYASDHGTLLAIVAHCQQNNFEEITQALLWYAGYLDLTPEQFEVTMFDPRPPGYMRVV